MYQNLWKTEASRISEKKKKKIITPDKKLGVASVAELIATTPANSPNYYTRIQPLAI